MFPQLVTDRFILRNITEADCPVIFEGLSNPAVIQYYGVSYQTLQQTKAQLEFYQALLANETGIWWGIAFKETPQLLAGACGFNALVKEHRRTEIGYWLLPRYWSMGIMMECLPVIIRHAFNQLNIHRIEAVVETGNTLSSKLLLKLGFQNEGIHQEAEIKNGRFISLQYFALLNNPS